jgi:PAS domain S-box-containing protein
MGKEDKSASEIKLQRIDDVQKKNYLINGSQLSESEILKLIYELQLHQVELECQNEELKRAKEQADIASDKYAQLYNFAPVGYFTLSPENTIVELNFSGSQLLGSNRSACIGRRFDLYLSDESKPIFQLFISRVFESGSSESCEVILFVADHSPVYVQLIGIANEAGDQCLLTVVDITIRKRAEKELKNSQLLMRSGIESQRETILVAMDLNYRYLYFNKTHSALMKSGYNVVIEPGMNMLDCISSENDRQLARENCERAMHGESFSEIRRFGITEIDWYESYYNPILNDKNEIVGVTILARNINRRILAEESLKNSEELLRKTQELAHLGSWELDLITNKLIWSDEVYCIFGFVQDEFVVTYDALMEAVHPDDREALSFAYFNSVKEDKEGYEIEHRIIHGSTGKVRFVHEKCTHFRDDSGAIIRSVGMVQDITERRHAEMLLRENEEIFNCFLEHSPVYVFFKDENIRSLRLSKNYEALLEKPIEELLGKNMFDLFPTKLAESMVADDQRILKEGNVISIREEFNGRFYSTIKFPVLAEGKPHYLAGFTLDITDQKLAEMALERSEERLRLILRSSKDAPWDWDLITNDLYYSPQWWAMLGYGVNELTPDATLWERLLHPGDRQLVDQIFLGALRNGLDSYELEFHLQHKNGHYVPILSRGFILRDINGNPVRISGTNSDLIFRKQAEKELIESRELYRDLIELAVDGILLGSGDGLILDANTCLCSMLGITREELIGTYFGNLVFAHDGLNHSTSQLKLIKKGEVIISERNILPPAGNEISIEIRTKMMPNGTYQSIFRDITLRKRSESEIKRKNQQLQLMNDEKDKYFSIIAHDLRNPFSGFLGLTEQMAKGLHRMTLEEIHTIANLMSKSATNLFRLLGNLLEWSRMQRGLIKFVPTSFLLMPHLSESIMTVVESANSKNIAINYDIPEDLKVFSDRNILEAILRNLISNAVKFTPHGGNVSVSARLLNHNQVEISIIDSGIGMNHKMIKNLFRLDINTNRKGTEGELSTGLGLIICKDLIEMHGGKLTIDSLEGKGSTFRFTLPAKKSAN